MQFSVIILHLIKSYKIMADLLKRKISVVRFEFRFSSEFSSLCSLNRMITIEKTQIMISTNDRLLKNGRAKQINCVFAVHLQISRPNPRSKLPFIG